MKGEQRGREGRGGEGKENLHPLLDVGKQN